MTYSIDQFVKKIKAPIVCRFDGKEILFKNGEELAAYQFEKSYTVEAVTIEENKAVITLSEISVPNVNWNGEEEVSFF